jgi:glycosyltransferase involved in cell wall biosynthesis
MENETNNGITLCLTNYNRYDMLLESFAKVLDDSRITEIVIVDDHSNASVVSNLRHLHFKNGKVKIYYNDHNTGVYKNKYRSVEYAKNKWVIVFDSDNIITPKYIDALYNNLPWDEKTFYLPSFAQPHFDYRHLHGTYTRENIASILNKPNADCMLNTMNFFCNRERYIQNWDITIEPITADSIYVNYLQLRSGGKLKVVPGLEYEHRVHKDSHFKHNQHRSPQMHKKIMEKLKRML